MEQEEQEDSASSPWGRGREGGQDQSCWVNTCGIFQIPRAVSASGGLGARRRRATSMPTTSQ